MNKKDLKNVWLIILLFIIILIIILNNKYAFGNTANYYKELDLLNTLKNNFLNTKKLIPTFINDNGIYFSSYNYIRYGIVNPLVILSFFINVSLGEYYSVIGVISIGIGIILLYKFLVNSGYNRYSVLITVSLLIININIYNIMFNSIINMFLLPLIVLSFMGAKKRLEGSNGLLLSISILLISIVNYTYLLPVIVSLIIYGIYSYYINNEIILIKKIIWYLLNYIVPILIGLLLASFALIPIVDNLRRNSINLININYDINIIIILSIIYGLFGNKRGRFLSVIMFISILLFKDYYLMYIVLLGMMVCNFVDGIIKDKIDYKIIIVGIIISLLYLFYNGSNLLMIIFLLLSMFLYKDTNKKKYLLLIVLLIFVSTLYNCLEMKLYNRDLIYSNSNYNENNYNSLYQMFNGNNKISNDLIGYKKYMNDQGKIYYKNDDVLYKGFATNNIISYEDYEKLNGLAKQEVILTNIVTDTHSKNEYVSYVKKIKIDKDKYNLKLDDNTKYVFSLDKEYKNKIIYIEFEATSNNCDDSRIKINNVEKDISCKKKKYTYTITDNNIKEIVVNINKGDYKINNIKAYSLDYGRINNSKMELDEFNIVTENSSIIGKIGVAGAGYFVINIPYNNGYEVKLDGNVVKYENVDNNYIGIPISKGKHVISINYDKKYRLMTWFFSYLGLVFMFLVNYIEKKRKFT